MNNKLSVVHTTYLECISNTISTANFKRKIAFELAMNDSWHGLNDLDDPSEGYWCDINSIIDITINKILDEFDKVDCVK